MWNERSRRKSRIAIRMSRSPVWRSVVYERTASNRPPGAGRPDEWSIFSGRVTCWGRSLAGMKVGPNDQRKNRVGAARYSGLAELLENACESERIRISCWNVASTGGRRPRAHGLGRKDGGQNRRKPADSAAVLGLLPGPAILIDGSRHAGRWEEIG